MRFGGKARGLPEARQVGTSGHCETSSSFGFFFFFFFFLISILSHQVLLKVQIAGLFNVGIDRNFWKPAPRDRPNFLAFRCDEEKAERVRVVLYQIPAWLQENKI
jgi:hypothetical protein